MDFNVPNDNVAALVNFEPIAKLRKSMFGDADLRGEWMAEYGLNAPVKEERQVESRELAPLRRSARREYLRR